MKTIFEKISSLLVLNYFLMFETVNGLAESNYICALSLHPEGLESQTINLAWNLLSHEDCIASRGHLQAVANCSASFFGTPTATNFSIWYDDKTVLPMVSLCPTLNGTSLLTQFLFIEEFTTALRIQLNTLGTCLLKQPYTAEFCQEQVAKQSALEKAELTWALTIGGILFVACMVGYLRACYTTCKTTRNFSTISNASNTTTLEENLSLLERSSVQTERSSTTSFVRLPGNNSNNLVQAQLAKKFYPRKKKGTAVSRLPGSNSNNLVQAAHKEISASKKEGTALKKKVTFNI